MSTVNGDGGGNWDLEQMDIHVESKLDETAGSRNDADAEIIEMPLSKDAEKNKFLSGLSLNVATTLDQVPSGSHIVTITSAIQQYLNDLQAHLTEKEFRKSKKIVWDSFGQLESQPPSSELSAFITKTINSCREIMNSNPAKKKYRALSELLEVLKNPKNVEKKAKVLEETMPPSPSEAEAKKQKKLKKLEKRLRLLGEKIKEYDEQECNWDSDEEINSSYMIKTRLVEKYMCVWKELCRLDGAITGTDRPVQKVVHIRQVTRYPEIDQEAEKFLNSKGVLFVPDYPDILKLVTEANRSYSLYIAEDDLGDLAREVFQYTVRYLKQRRGVDFTYALNFSPEEDLVDPAENDPELARKLAENLKNRKTEDEVMREFSANAEKVATAEEVADSDPDASAPEDDDEDESEELAVEIDLEEPDSPDDPVVVPAVNTTVNGLINKEMQTSNGTHQDQAPVSKISDTKQTQGLADDDEIVILEELPATSRQELEDGVPPVKRQRPTRRAAQQDQKK